jgi:mRNA-degrading endonuclease toxin of MazEF toxin-antitoxin module
VERGDVYQVDLNPIQGREQAGARFVLIVSPKVFNILLPTGVPDYAGREFSHAIRGSPFL